MPSPVQIRPRKARQGADLPRRRDERDIKQHMCTAFECWSSCSRPSCQRDKRCRGDSLACFERYWIRLPDAFHPWIVAASQARRDGLSIDDAKRAADRQIPSGSGAAQLPWIAEYLRSFDEGATTPRAAVAARRVQRRASGGRVGRI